VGPDVDPPGASIPPTGPLGFIGLGRMGGPMARRVAARWPLVVNDRRPEVADELASLGATWAGTPADVSSRCRLVCLSLPGPVEVEAVLTGPDGIFEGAPAGLVVVDFTTSSYEAARALADRGRDAGVVFVDAPVSGGVVRARAGTLTVMVSGPQAAIDEVWPVLETVGEQLFHVSEEVGTATLVKLLNNAIGLAGALLAQEAMVVAAKAGLDVPGLLDVLEVSSAAPMLGPARAALQREFDVEDVGMTVDLAEKDLRLAVEVATRLQAAMPMAAAALQIYSRARHEGLGDLRTFATLRTLEEAAGTRVSPDPPPTSAPAR
jgi:3-hydroxyisobutyrate dehydrogenase-like beta-hydroxyacid dehydrogenase